ncbi:MAG: lysylphosphatidylglycerol synthase transmembrane domain-containing protein [Pyrinomonadaceae bacterium]
MSSNREVQITGAPKKIPHLHLIVILLTLAGVALFSYFVYSVGAGEIFKGVERFGFDGFAFILFLYFMRILARSAAWRLSVYEPYRLSLRDAIGAVIIGEALSSMIPLGILISGATKAIVVRKKIPLVAGLSSVATENLFYCLGTGFLLIFGAIAFLKTFQLSAGWTITLDALIALVFLLIFFGILMIIRQWHWASAVCEWLYERGYLTKILENGRLHVRLFENLIYGFYRRYPQRFVPIFLLQILFHALGVAEVWFVLSRISDTPTGFYTAFLLESMSRVIIVVFKLIPFLIGVDEAGARYVTQTLRLGAEVGVTLAIIRKGRILFWAAIGVILILKRGLSVREIFRQSELTGNFANEEKNVVATGKFG